MASNNIILVDLIGEVVDSMRAIGEITGSAEVSPGVYTIASVNELKNKEVISINSVDYVVRDASGSSFTIDADTGLDFTGSSWKALAPYYEYGHIKEIAKTLSKKNNDDFVFKKYPLIILFQDYEVKKDVGQGALFGTVSANFAIVNYTEPNLVSKERYDYNFRNVLFPIYDAFLEAIVNIDYFETSPNEPYVSHSEYERPYWGSDLANPNKNILNDWIDAIELQNVELKILNGIKDC